jgi:hypothetical protein
MKSYLILVGAVIPLCALAGCGREERLKVCPVQGKVLVVGTPAGNASVFFYPCDPAQQHISTATTAPDGTFWLTTFVSGDGAPEGEYDVTVVWPDYSMPCDECAAPLHDRLKLQYADRKKTELHATIRPGKNEVILNVLMGGGWSFPPQRERQR